MVDLRGVGEGLRLGDYDVVVVEYHDLGGGFGCWCCWRQWSELEFGLGGWSGDVAFACAPGEGDSVHEGVVRDSGVFSRLEWECAVMVEGRGGFVGSLLGIASWEVCSFAWSELRRQFEKCWC